jgi:hypothetical protein
VYYGYGLQPDTFSIRCPRCGKEARFSLPFKFFRLPDGRKLEDLEEPSGHIRHSYTPGFQPGTDGEALADYENIVRIAPNSYVEVRFPDLFPWKGKATYPIRNTNGVCSCLNCGYRSRHELKWPNDAYYRVEYRSKVLWGWTRADMLTLKRFIESGNRDEVIKKAYPGANVLLWRLPAVFLLAKNREDLLKRIEKLLENS